MSDDASLFTLDETCEYGLSRYSISISLRLSDSILDILVPRHSRLALVLLPSRSWSSLSLRIMRIAQGLLGGRFFFGNRIMLGIQNCVEFPNTVRAFSRYGYFPLVHQELMKGWLLVIPHKTLLASGCCDMGAAG
ncbi:hypothetical protein Hypma_012089 [Hypsizygus marmoreus]|uniref:Uncharacterized protein n=1 Tax=Hypsizygus marmoreus TaxID=39966 RepID=A0A369JMZ1_HYPMA|nr:hypothetical protein Hypma_012089 [Hypsizygus marmoreus]